MAHGLRAAVVWSALQTGVRFTLGIATIKVTAVVLGPAGLALVGQLSNVISLVTGVLGNATQTAVVKETAREQAAGRPLPLDMWGTAARWLLGLALTTAILLAAASDPLSRWLFDRSDLGWAVVLAAAGLPLALLFNWIQGVLLGIRAFRLVAITQMASASVGAIIVIGLTYVYGLPGALVGATLSVAFAFVVALACTHGAGLQQVTHSLRRWRRTLLRPILGHYPMLLVRAAAVPLAALLVRSALIDQVGVAEAGLWQAASRITDNYTLVVASVLSMYVTSTLSGIRDAGRFRSAVFGMALGTAALVAVLAIGVFVAREWIVNFLLTPAFSPVTGLLGWMLLGDVFRMAAWPLSSALVVQNRWASYMLIEAGTAACQVGATHLLLKDHGLEAAPLAYCGTWLIVFATVGLMHARPSEVAR